jgi:hypothetical protein
MQHYYVGLDLGQQQDYTAVAVAERQGAAGDAYHLRHLERLPLGTAYPAVVAHVQALLAQPPLPGQATLVVDGTGVGLPVVDLLRAAPLSGAPLVPVLITAGDQVSHEQGLYRVPKRTLVAALQVLLQGERVKIAATLPESATLERELLGFKVKVTAAAHETYEAWREGIHDDLVLAAALALWRGEYERTHRWGAL